MRRVFTLVSLAVLAVSLVPACGDDDSDDGDASTDTDTDTDTDSDSDAGPDGGEPFDCTEIECPDGGVFYVDTDATGAATGLSWADAADNLQLGLAMGECCAPAQLWVAEGTYIPGSAQEDTFQLIGGVALYGGFAGTETALEERDWDAHPTVLSGADDPTPEDGLTGGTFHVVTGASGATLDGFTITGGGVLLPETEDWWDEIDIEEHYRGGGMYNVGCDETLVVSHCIFSENFLTYGMGAGMYNEDSSPLVTECVFQGNRGSICQDYPTPCGPGGGAMANIESSPVVADSSFEGNRAENGGAILNDSSSLQIAGCSFSENTAIGGAAIFGGDEHLVVADSSFDANATSTHDVTFGAGGAIAWGAGNLTISRSTFRGNTAGDGGAVVVYGTSLAIVDSAFGGNSLHNGISGSGAGILLADGADAEIVSSVFSNNSGGTNPYSPPEGGAIYADETIADLAITNCSFYGNSSDVGGAIYASAATVANSIFFGDSPDELSGPDGGVYDVTYSLVQGGHAGGGNLDADPLFVDAAAGDLHLQSGSPCIDAADTALAPEFDLEGNARVGEADMGAYEFTGEK